jgi:hypothetical protein
MPLIYRGEVINRPEQPVPAYRKPYALNWRYQVPNEDYGAVSRPMQAYRAPRAINWRWQMAVSMR